MDIVPTCEPDEQRWAEMVHAPVLDPDLRDQHLVHPFFTLPASGTIPDPVTVSRSDPTL